MPFLPLLFVWEVFTKTSSFALGWATSRVFGQVPGDRGRAISAAAVMSVAWVLAVVAAGLPFALAALLESLRLTRLGDWALGRREAALLLGWLITVPPIVAAIGEVSASREHRSLRHWVTALPLSYPIALSLGGAVLIMVMLTPLVTLKRTLQGRTTLYIPIVVRDGRIRELVADVQKWLAELGHRTEPRTQVGLGSWPMRVIRFAAAHYFGSAVMSDPMQLRAGAVEVTIAPTTVSVVAPKDEAFPLRAAIHKRLALTQVFLTWSEEPQRFEEELMALHGRREMPLEEVARALERLQERIDRAHIKNDEWDLLYRLRLQVERDAYERGRAEARSRRTA